MRRLSLILASSIALLQPALAAELQGPRPEGMGRPGGGPGFGPGMMERVKALDANHDGVISKDEFRGPPERFQLLDRNSDGRLDAEEIPALRMLSQAQGPGEQPPPPAPDKPKKEKKQKKSAKKAPKLHEQPLPAGPPPHAFGAPGQPFHGPQAPGMMPEGPPRHMAPMAPMPPKPRREAPRAKPEGKNKELAQVERAIMLLARKPALLRELAQNPKVRQALAEIRAAAVGAAMRAPAAGLRAPFQPRRPMLRDRPHGVGPQPAPDQRRGQPRFQGPPLGAWQERLPAQPPRAQMRGQGRGPCPCPFCQGNCGRVQPGRDSGVRPLP